ncbi:hypothetical protein FA15DRAFT_673069 [Coprinopsis marcescibilis]|uniref:DUF6533 domain-containing protein n=1 Tax=Coprinopsis marcescibilis TaxID=230819 RepID=A0A5C3KKL7_COPMA|nr:hypothetical protein FA15DRAFT_673069 [Coprinopsis marcescibilis]
MSSEGVDPALIATLTQVAYNRQVVNRCLAALFTLVLVDYFHTLPDEVRLFWPKKWSLIKVLFILSRYFLFAYGPLWIYVNFNATSDFVRCGQMSTASTYMMIVGVVIAESIMFIRVSVICGGGWLIRSWLIFQFVGVHGALFGTIYLFTVTSVYQPSPIPSIMSCFYIADSSRLAIGAGLLMSSGTLILILSIAGFWRFRESGNKLATAFNNAGIAYFVVLSIISITNMIVYNALPPEQELRFIMGVPQAILHCILACRMILHLYRVSERTMEYANSSNYPMSDVQFHVAARTAKGPTTVGTESTGITITTTQYISTKV